ncbi:hypothetical protein Vretifemale_18428 [Volvox reticuliferus]|uniref:Ankyrin repeat protein n=1 Tax=Volvox reticuliferus TaxID=1737510 RepID=A0A8J4FUF5_9CHLO|nr:hypothetical protein Vretifemale_18428 [Volvox reticuliferus]
MGCGPSSLAVVELNRTLKAGDGSHMLQDKLQSSPWLLSAATPVLSGTADTPLHTACERKQLEVVQQMLSFLSSATLPVVREALGPYCSRKGRALPISVCEGVSIAVDMVNCKGQTPLMCACAADSPELVKLLLVQGADPWVGDRCGSRTALHYAAMSGSTACIEALMQNIPVRNMARHGIRYINVRSICGLTALHYAVFFDHPSAVEELLSHDPHLNAATISHSYDVLVTCDALSTPMHFAAVRGNAEVVRMMLRQYAQSSSSTANSRSREPRLRVNHGGQLPWQIAATYHPANRDLVALLHPGAPLEQVLGLEGVGERGAGAAYPPASCDARRPGDHCGGGAADPAAERPAAAQEVPGRRGARRGRPEGVGQV